MGAGIDRAAEHSGRQGVDGWLGLALFLKLRGEDLHIILHEWRIYGMLGALIVLPFLCFAWGQQYVDSGLAGVINSAAPCLR